MRPSRCACSATPQVEGTCCRTSHARAASNKELSTRLPQHHTWYSKARMAWVSGLAANCRQSPPTYWLGYSPAAEPERGAAESSGSARRTCGRNHQMGTHYQGMAGMLSGCIAAAGITAHAQHPGIHGRQANKEKHGKSTATSRQKQGTHQLVVLHTSTRQHHARRSVVGGVEVSQHLCEGG